MSKYYKAEDVDKLIANVKSGYGMSKSTDELVADLPTIDIVHCKDCKWSESNGSNTDGYFCHHGHHNPLYQVFSLHFCSYGERIDNE